MKIKLVYLLAFLCLILTDLQAQNCGTVISEEDRDALLERSEYMVEYNARTMRGMRDFPIQAHVLRTANGDGGISVTNLNRAINKLNSYFYNANIRFVLLKDIHYINSDRHFDFNLQNEMSFTAVNDKQHVINLYLFNSINDGGGQLCGYAHYPNKYSYKRDRDRVLMRNSCVDQGTTLIHEFGHFFSLFHTHGNKQVSSEKELVTRDANKRNCSKAGDGLCDTPADPGLWNKVDNNCNYMGAAKDPAGYKYRPDPSNMMAYSLQGCRDNFSEQQYNRMNYTAHHLRNYLKFPAELDKGDEIEFVSVIPEQVKTDSKLSGQLILQICGQTTPVQLDGNVYKCKDDYYSGTSYEMFIRNDEKVFIYAFASDLTKQNYLLFPTQGESAFVSTSDEYISLPGRGNVFTMDETTGKDYLCVLYSKKPLPIQSIMKNMRYQDGNFMQRLYKVIGQELITSNQISYSNNAQIKFSADASVNDIVPIVLELKHL